MFGADSGFAEIKRLPTGGPIIRIVRDYTADRVFIKFGGDGLTVNLSDADMMELVPGVIEELENPDGSRYDRFYLYSSNNPVQVSISCSPTYERTL